jgi:hypothetical protein
MVRRAGDPPLWRVLVGREPTIDGANALAQRLRQEKTGHCFCGPHRCRSIRYSLRCALSDADDPVQVYLREVGTIPLLTIAEEARLSHHVLAHSDQANPQAVA